MIKAVLIDDDEISLQILQHALFAQSGLVEVSGAFTDVEAAIAAIRSMPVDLVMLDIEMPAVNGLKLAQRLSSLRENLALVFVTAHSQYALDAFRANAVDYIVKPVSEEEVARVLLKVQHKLRMTAFECPRPLIDPKPFRIQTAGVLSVHAGNEEPVRLTETIAELFVYLVCHRDTRISKGHLCALFWPEQDPDQAMHSLYTAVYRLKKMLRESGFPFDLLSHHGSYQVVLWDCAIDYEAVQRLARLGQPVAADTLPAYEAVVTGFPSAFLEVHGYAWARPLNEQIERDYRMLAMKLMRGLLECGRLADAVTLGQSLEKRFPYDDDVQTTLLQAMVLYGEDAAVKAQYERYRRRLLQDRGTTPSVQFIRSYFQMLGQ